MVQTKIRVYGYRWVVLVVFSLIQFGLQVLWATFLPITGDAAVFYNVTPLAIGFLAMLFMIVYVFSSLPCSWIISRYGIHKGVGLGVIAMGIFGLFRGVFAEDYTAVAVCTFFIALVQPLIINSITTVTAKWFPVDERATATGIALLAQFMGIMAGMIVTPFLVQAVGIKHTLLYYGGFVAVICVLFLFIYREQPPTKSSLVEEEDAPLNMREGLKNMFKTRDAMLILMIFSIGLSVFNTLSTWIEQIVAPRGFNSVQAGSLGGVMMLGAILGCILLPLLSDKIGKRKVFIVSGMLIIIPCLMGITFFETFLPLLVAGGILGFFQLGLAPIIMEAAADVSRPSTEATTQGVLFMFGQGLSFVMIFMTDLFRSDAGAMTPFLLVFACMVGLNAIIAAWLSEPHIIGEKNINLSVGDEIP